MTDPGYDTAVDDFLAEAAEAASAYPWPVDSEEDLEEMAQTVAAFEADQIEVMRRL